MTAAVRTELTLVVGLALLGITQQRRPGPAHRLRPAHPVLSLLADLIAPLVRPLWPVIERMQRWWWRSPVGVIATVWGAALFVWALTTARSVP